MKLKLLFLASICFASVIKGQNAITVTYRAANPVGTRFVKTTTDAQAQALDPAQAITVNLINAPAGTTVAALFNTVNRTVTGVFPTFTIGQLSAAEIGSYATYNIVVTAPGESATYSRVATPAARPFAAPAVATSNRFPATSAVQELARAFTGINPSDFGLTVTSTTLTNYAYLGDQYSHIFLDQFGNSLLGAIPQGISNRQYVVHIIYLTDSSMPAKISYSVKQTKGSFSSSIVFNNAGQLGSFGVQGVTGQVSPPAITYIWVHQEFLLRTSTDNIEFEVSRNILNTQGLLTLETSVVAKHTVEMSKVFHGSFDIGLISTHLENPTLTLVPSVSDPNQTVVKRTRTPDRGIVTAMATFYTSPIILIEKYLLRKDIPNYKLTGRNFLDDHKIYERIFPAIGVSISDQTFKNLFLGLNWELARGACVFVGWHYGEINYFREDNNFKYEETVINQAEFDLRSSKKWDYGFAIGANLDLLVVTNLFKQIKK